MKIQDQPERRYSRKKPKNKQDRDIVQPDLTNLRLRNPVDGAHSAEIGKTGAVEIGGLTSPRPNYRRADEHNQREATGGRRSLADQLRAKGISTHFWPKSVTAKPKSGKRGRR